MTFIPPGTYTGRISHFEGVSGQLRPRIELLSHQKADMDLLMKNLSVYGHSIMQIKRGSGKSGIHGKVLDYILFTDGVGKGQRSLRNRHHNRKAQPNCGPRKPNQW